MRNYMKKLLPAFICGETMNTATASVRNGIFYSYATPIAKISQDEKSVFLVEKYFSRTTNSQQKAIREFCENHGLEIVKVSFESFKKYL